MVDLKLVADLLELAAEDVMLNGLAKGEFGDPGGPRCALGHLQTYAVPNWNHGITPDDWDWELEDLDNYYEAAAALTYHLLGHRQYAVIPIWSDDPERTAENVREAYLQTAKEIRNGHA